MGTTREWPDLPYQEWKDTRATLHMYAQVIGKLRLALSPFEPEWANVPLYLSARGLTTSAMPAGLGAVDAELDLVDHVLVLRTTDGAVERRPLGGAVADYYRDVVDALARLHVDVALSPVPSEVSDPIPFAEDRKHATYEPAHVHRFWHTLAMVDAAFKGYRARFRGKTSLVSFWWGSFDLSLARFSGRPATPRPGAGIIERFGGDAEQICCGWWPGDERHPQPAFFAYAYPAPGDIERATIRPAGAAWDATLGEFVMPYDVARTAPDPHQAILDFATSTYDAAASLLRWDSALTAVEVPG